MNNTGYDLVIIGGGPIGLACGIEAKKAGLNYMIVDKGCLVNSLYNYPLNMTFFSTSEKLEIGDVPFVSHLPKPNRDEALEYYRRVAMHWKLNISLYAEVTDFLKKDKVYQVVTSKGIYNGKAVVIATGFYDIPLQLNIEGEELPKVLHYYKEPHPFFGQKVAVIGAANSAIDVALECWRKGAEVTMIIRGSSISDRVKYWVKPDIDNRIKEGSIKAVFNSEVTKITPNEIFIRTPSGEKSIQNDFVLAMTGYQPDFSILIKAGILLDESDNMQPDYNPETMETNQKGIYLAGVICGGYNTHKWFIENSRVHAELIVKDLVKKLRT